ncbi:MAG TPA: PilT/PilU family type 4a pilus ATPase [Solirubrobacteraceae bacterium]|nr:PilT/PilU family type 4a pilus ATPase [Solirubrobacteraceae bacterium]
MIDLDQAMRTLVAREGSDLHLKAGAPPMARIEGELQPLDPALPPVGPGELEELVAKMVGSGARLEEFHERHEIDMSRELAGVARFRINARQQRGGVALVIRAIPHHIRTIEELALPPVIATMASEPRGIILVTGTTGSGKSTTLAAMINHINVTRAANIVTIEDPIEFVHEDRRSIIGQREVGVDTHSFKDALRRVLRQDPDVILIGEMRDEETVQTAMSAAETGHLVLSTIHTLDASESINRMLEFFPPNHHQQVRSMLASTLRGIISQRLVPAIDGGRVAVCEILRMTGRARDKIIKPGDTVDLASVIMDGAYDGMQSFDQALYTHVKSGRVAVQDAMHTATSPHDFKLLLEAEGRRGTTMDDVPTAVDEDDEDDAADSPAPAAGGFRTTMDDVPHAA